LWHALCSKYAFLEDIRYAFLEDIRFSKDIILLQSMFFQFTLAIKPI